VSTKYELHVYKCQKMGGSQWRAAGNEPPLDRKVSVARLHLRNTVLRRR
jgi:hypothetical protein